MTGCPLNRWPTLGNKGRAWVRNRPEPEDAEAKADPQCFVCGKTLVEHFGTTPEKYCTIPKNSTKPFCDESFLRSKWAKKMQKLYRMMAADMEDQQRRFLLREAQFA